MGVSPVRKDGYAVFDRTEDTAAWARAALPRAQAAIADPGMRRQWLTCEETWFVGVDALDNTPEGALAGVPLRGPALDAVRANGWPVAPLHKAQVSAVWPGYPRPREGEGEAAFGYRLRRDAAHVDGLRAEGKAKRRFLREPHAYILGIALTAPGPEAAPLVVWQGSHRIMAQAFAGARAATGRRDLGDEDLTEVYQQARARVFEQCRRVELPLRAGASVLVHRLTLHGVAPWIKEQAAKDAKDASPRIIAYFRPELADWSGWHDIAR